jgi:exonuclease VII large subunit
MTLSFALNAPLTTDQVWSVGQLNASVKRLIETHAPMQLWVRGEIVQCKVYSSGHWYFSLREGRHAFRQAAGGWH